MPNVVRYGDLSSAHGCWPERVNDEASEDVFINGIGCHRQGDHWIVHCCAGNCHDSYLSQGSPNVFANGKEVGRIGDPIACGSICIQGSPNVFANGN